MQTADLNLMQAALMQSGTTGSVRAGLGNALSGNTLGGAGDLGGFSAVLAQLLGGGDAEKDPLAMLGAIGTEDQQSDSLLTTDTGFSLEEMFQSFMGNATKKSDDLTGQLEAMQILAQTLGFSTTQTPVDPAGALMAGGQSSLQTLLTIADPALLNQYLESVAPQVAQQTTETAKTSMQNKGEGLFTIPTLEVATVETGTATPIEAFSALQGSGNFRSAVLQAQQLMTNRTTEDSLPVEAIDVEAMQKRVDEGVYLNDTTKTGENRLPEPGELLKQAESGIRQNLAAGKSEFVVKLKPDGLGEITVKLIEGENKLSLTIVTASSETAKLLTGELEALKLSLRPLNTEVREIIVQNPETRQQEAQNATFTGFHQGQQSQQQGARQQQGGRSQDDYLGLEEAPSEWKTVLSELDTYI